MVRHFRWALSIASSPLPRLSGRKWSLERGGGRLGILGLQHQGLSLLTHLKCWITIGRLTVARKRLSWRIIDGGAANLLYLVLWIEGLYKVGLCPAFLVLKTDTSSTTYIPYYSLWIGIEKFPWEKPSLTYIQFSTLTMAPKARAIKVTDRHPFLLAVDDVSQLLGTSIETGLTASKVAELQRTYPSNELEGGGGISWHKILIKQISNAMILVRSTFLRRNSNSNNQRSSFSQWLWVTELAITSRAEFWLLSFSLIAQLASFKNSKPKRRWTLSEPFRPLVLQFCEMEKSMSFLGMIIKFQFISRFA